MSTINRATEPEKPLRNRVRIEFSWQTVFCLLLSTVASAGDPRLETLLQKTVSKGYPGIAMLIEGQDGGVTGAAAGYSDLEHLVPLRVDDGFHIASISKTFTAAATLRLVDRKELALNATLKELLGDAVARIP
jgi:CubicO group peptidase (beta-lactamase class C family)